MEDLKDLRLADLYLAYRKAKADSYYETSHFDALGFLEYEEHLHRNLKRLLHRLKEGRGWENSLEVGSYAYQPKSVELGRDDVKLDGMFFKCLDPFEEWRRQWSGGNRAQAKFRLIIRPTVEFQVFSALWIIEAGHKFDNILDPATSFGHRLRRAREPLDLEGGRKPLNVDCIGLFEPYFSAYQQWREGGLRAMRSRLTSGERVFGVTMDIQSFYHRATPDFLLRDSFLGRFEIVLSTLQQRLTSMLIDAIHLWYAATPDAILRPSGGLPVGLSASKIIANVLLAELDQKMVERLSPFYYGRYVDDIFLVFDGAPKIQSGVEMMKHLESRMGGTLEFEPASELGNDQLKLILSYAPRPEADLVFAGEKQKVFNLYGKHGLDLVAQIDAQIRLHSSEHRLLAVIPTSGEEMAARTLLAQTNAALEPDALRKADVVSVKRLGIALMLRDMESYARDLSPGEWKDIRENFYQLVYRHVLTPLGYFNFAGHLPRVLGLMVSCGDYGPATEMLSRILAVRDILKETTSAGIADEAALDGAMAALKRSLAQAVAQATTVAYFKWSKRLLQLSRELDQVHPHSRLPKSTDPFKRLSKRLLHADLGRRPYREAWLAGGPKGLANPPVPGGIDIRRQLRLGAIRSFRKVAKLKTPYWPGIAFPTRPISLSEITRAAPDFLRYPRELRAALFAMRGAKAHSHEGVLLSGGDTGEPKILQVDGPFKDIYRIAIPSFLTTHEEWDAAVAGRPRLTAERYVRIRRMINAVLQETPQVDYVVFPECSMPHHWVGTLARKLADRKISLIAGLEYRISSKGLHNDAYLSIATDWPWHNTSVIYIQPKFEPAHEERRTLAKQKKRLAITPASFSHPTIIQHDRFSFAVLICSDLTNISYRYQLQGRVDALVVVEWNRDTETFGSLVESTANDLHAYIVQSNNRQYGDSRVRVPRRNNFERDVVRVRGGSQDYFVVADLDIKGLRAFQSTTPASSSGLFKPTPMGYVMSKARGGTK